MLTQLNIHFPIGSTKHNIYYLRSHRDLNIQNVGNAVRVLFYSQLPAQIVIGALLSVLVLASKR